MINLIILLAVNFAALIIIYAFLRKRIEKAFSSTELLTQIESEVEAVITELNRTTERNITLIEDKIRSLEGEIKKADHRLTLLKKRAAEEVPEQPAVYTKPRPPKAAPLRTEVTSEAGGLTPAINLPVQEKPLTQRERVLLLHGKGMDRNSIASQLGITLGEVDLIVSLSERNRMREEKNEQR